MPSPNHVHTQTDCTWRRCAVNVCFDRSQWTDILLGNMRQDWCFPGKVELPYTEQLRICTLWKYNNCSNRLFWNNMKVPTLHVVAVKIQWPYEHNTVHCFHTFNSKFSKMVGIEFSTFVYPRSSWFQAGWVWVGSCGNIGTRLLWCL